MEDSEICLQKDALINYMAKDWLILHISQVTEIIASHDNEIELQMVHQVVDKLKIVRLILFLNQPI